MTWVHYFGDLGATCTYLFSMLNSLLVAPIFFSDIAIEHSPRNFAFGLATPSSSLVFSGLTHRPERTLYLSHVFFFTRIS